MLIDLALLALAFSADADLDDQALARRIRDGDPAAFRAFFERHHGTLVGYLRRRHVPPDIAADLVQQAFVRLWERRAEIDLEKSLRAYLFRIAHTRALNHFRNTAKFDYSAEAEPSAAPTNPGDAASYALLEETLHRAIEALPERRRAVFELCFLQELTYREAAEVLGISIKTVEHQMGHALKAVRAALAAFRDV